MDEWFQKWDSMTAVVNGNSVHLIIQGRGCGCGSATPLTSPDTDFLSATSCHMITACRGPEALSSAYGQIKVSRERGFTRSSASSSFPLLLLHLLLLKRGRQKMTSRNPPPPRPGRNLEQSYEDPGPHQELKAALVLLDLLRCLKEHQRVSGRYLWKDTKAETIFVPAAGGDQTGSPWFRSERWSESCTNICTSMPEA